MPGSAVEDKLMSNASELLLDFLQYFIGKTFVPQDFGIDAGTSLEASMALDIVDDFIDLGFAVTESLNAGGIESLMILKYPPPATS